MKSSQTHTSYVLSAIGMAFYWIFFRRSYFGLLLSSHTEVSPSSQDYYLIFIVSVLAFGILSVLRHYLLESLIHRKPLVVFILSLCATLSGLLMFASPSFGSVVGPLSIIGIIILALNFLLLTFTWSSVVIQSKRKPMLLVTILSFLLSYVISFCFLLPEPIPVVLAIIAPAASGACWFFCPKEKVKSTKMGLVDIKKLQLGLIGVLAFFLLAGGIMRGLVYSGTINYIPSSDSVLPHVISIILALMMFFLVLLFRQNEKFFNLTWILLATLFFAGLFLIASFNSEFDDIAHGVLISGRTCLSFFLWVTLVDNIRLKQLSSVLVLSLFFIVTEMLSALLSYFFIPLLVNSISASFQEYTTLISFGMALMLIAASFLFLSNKAFVEHTTKPISPSDDSWQKAGEMLAVNHGLTKRETEVMILISKGHSVSKIAELLFVSTGTIQTHSKNIYRKMGLHSRQEIIDRVSKIATEV